MKKGVYLAVLLSSVALISLAHATSDLTSKVGADAQCTVTGTDFAVNAGLIQKDAPSAGPYVSTVTFSLEQNLPAAGGWVAVAGSSVGVTINQQFTLLPAGGRYDVASYTYSNVCSLLNPGANAVRAVVQITVDNAAAHRVDGNVFTARCGQTSPCTQ